MVDPNDGSFDNKIHLSLLLWTAIAISVWGKNEANLKLLVGFLISIYSVLDASHLSSLPGANRSIELAVWSTASLAMGGYSIVLKWKMWVEDVQTHPLHPDGKLCQPLTNKFWGSSTTCLGLLNSHTPLVERTGKDGALFWSIR